ncbi:243_t:CDS:1, partial [Acaulospora colombiana]
ILVHNTVVFVAIWLHALQTRRNLDGSPRSRDQYWVKMHLMSSVGNLLIWLSAIDEMSCSG